MSTKPNKNEAPKNDAPTGVTEVESLKLTVTSLEGANSNLRAELTLTQTENSALTSQLNDARKKAAELADKEEALTRLLDAKSAEADELRKSVLELQLELDRRPAVAREMHREDASYPPPYKDFRDARGNVILKAVPSESLRAEKFKEMGLTKCCHSRCHYPLKAVLDADRKPQRIKTSEGPAVLAVCTWHKGHLRDGDQPQYILDVPEET